MALALLLIFVIAMIIRVFLFASSPLFVFIFVVIRGCPFPFPAVAAAAAIIFNGTARANITSFLRTGVSLALACLLARSLADNRNRYGGRNFPRLLLSSHALPPSVQWQSLKSGRIMNRVVVAVALINKADLT